MGKWFGSVGFSKTEVTDPGVWEESVTVVKSYFGDIISNRWKRQNSGGINDDINISNIISIVADSFANENYSNIVYAEFLGIKWKVTDVEPQYPRLLLTLGGVYNGEQN